MMGRGCGNPPTPCIEECFYTFDVWFDTDQRLIKMPMSNAAKNAVTPIGKLPECAFSSSKVFFCSISLWSNPVTFR